MRLTQHGISTRNMPCFFSEVIFYSEVVLRTVKLTQKSPSGGATFLQERGPETLAVGAT